MEIKILEQVANVKFCFDMAMNVSQTLKKLKLVYGDKHLSQVEVRQWFMRFRESNRDVSQIKNLDLNLAKFDKLIRDMLLDDPDVTIQFVLKSFLVNEPHLRGIIKNLLYKRILHHQLVPKILSNDDIRARLEFSRSVIAASRQIPDFESCIIVSNETYCQYKVSNPTRGPSSAENLEQVFEETPDDTIRNTKLICFYDYKGLIYHEYRKKEQKDDHYHLHLVKQLLCRIHETRSGDEYREQNWFLLHNSNAPTFCNTLVRKQLAMRKVTLFEIPLNSPDLNPCKYFLQNMLQDVPLLNFSDISFMELDVENILKNIPMKKYSESIFELLESAQDCIDYGGKYCDLDHDNDNDDDDDSDDYDDDDNILNIFE